MMTRNVSTAVAAGEGFSAPSDLHKICSCFEFLKENVDTLLEMKATIAFLRVRLKAFCWVVIFLSNLALAQSNFVPVTNTVVTTQFVAGAGAAWADYDGDGWLDLAQANFQGPNLLFRNNGDGTFTLVTNSTVTVAGPQSYGVSWSDYDNNGRPDLFFSDGYDSGIRNLLFHNRTASGLDFALITTGPGSGSLTARSLGCSWADYDRDGLLDLFVANSGTPSELWHNRGDGTFDRVLAGPIVTNIADSIGAAWGDYDNDGWPDLFVANGWGSAGSPQQKNFLYHNNGDGTFTQVTDGGIVNDLGYFGGAAWGDYDNDGFLDLFVASNGGPNLLYHNNGDGTFTSVPGGDISGDYAVFVSAAWADYDNDGWLDLFVGNKAQGEPSRLFHNNGDGTFTRETAGPIAEDISPNGGCAWGDYDNDGFPDLFVSVLDFWNPLNPGFGYSRLYHNQGTTNNWVKIFLHPARSNGSAIGTKIRITAVSNGTPLKQMREINTGDGLSGSSQVALFGLGTAINPSSLSVEWPSGTITSIPFGIPGGSIDVWEPQPPILSNLKLTPSTNSPTASVEVQLTGDPTRFSFAPRLRVWHGYALEVSNDLSHWTQYDQQGFGLAPGRIFLDPTLIDTGINLSGPLFIRARDLGFVRHQDPLP